MPAVVWARGVNRRVDDKPGSIDRPFGRADQIAVKVDLDQIRSGYLAVPEAVRIDQEMPLRPRHALRNVVENHLGPTEQVENPVAGCEVDARIPLLAGRFRLAVGD
jgi:hypothetical protein